jgi:hypothetical protein
MSETTAETVRPFSPGPSPADGDLSREIERAATKQPQDRVRCVRVFGDYYRCNWWAPLISRTSPQDARSISWGTGATHHVRQSKFLVVTAREGALQISEVRR